MALTLAHYKKEGLSGFDTDVIPVVRVQAAYPRRAKQAGIEGSVTMEVLIKPMVRFPGESIGIDPASNV